MKKKIIAIVLSLVMLFSLAVLPSAAKKDDTGFLKVYLLCGLLYEMGYDQISFPEQCAWYDLLRDFEFSLMYNTSDYLIILDGYKDQIEKLIQLYDIDFETPLRAIVDVASSAANNGLSIDSLAQYFTPTSFDQFKKCFDVAVKYVAEGKPNKQIAKEIFLYSIASAVQLVPTDDTMQNLMSKLSGLVDTYKTQLSVYIKPEKLDEIKNIFSAASTLNQKDNAYTVILFLVKSFVKTLSTGDVFTDVGEKSMDFLSQIVYMGVNETLTSASPYAIGALSQFFVSSLSGNLAQMDVSVCNFHLTLNQADGVPYYYAKEVYDNHAGYLNLYEYTKESSADYTAAYENLGKLLFEGTDDFYDTRFSDAVLSLENAIDELVCIDYESDYGKIVAQYQTLKEAYNYANFRLYSLDEILSMKENLDGITTLLDEESVDETAYKPFIDGFNDVYGSVNQTSADILHEVKCLKEYYLFYSPSFFDTQKLNELLNQIYFIEQAVYDGEDEGIIESLKAEFYTAREANTFLNAAAVDFSLKNMSFSAEHIPLYQSMGEKWTEFGDLYASVLNRSKEAEGEVNDELVLDVEQLRHLEEQLYASPEKAVAVKEYLDYCQTFENFRGHMSDAEVQIVQSLLDGVEDALKNPNKNIDEYNQYRNSLYKYLSIRTSGDIDGDSAITLSDAMKAFQQVSKKTELIGVEKIAADVDFSGEVELSDAMKIFQYVAKKIPQVIRSVEF